ncbi:UDP-2,4-diacetamido-2,4,6-trideoxy-beta-L-altropyranose hydrolase [Paenibacillus endoradicis]|uniref:UDP-2,4-diacetamido-2,4, 6-trideoxy-beta-L-altropyranose hydrolase n=1 Tax=Paenibacillus endoradicis TaxID=2972487 RepID=UPI002158E456|nr:UDP-2,4-diacetamido-2,4,6-trideoxy-beta-L-altropyranose hydrolase [Paenibacillus endoradicis]MCR8660531.1 UDP-2,4-diacetamido-2,4,6-trideoxy-beta-L-altropyranose hydrolase [Paenibacillus endoradicis]
MNILIRTDASNEIGSGHVMRCLTIAYHLQNFGHHVTFWMDPLLGHMIDLVEKLGYVVIQKEQSVDILIVDHYQLDMTWEQQMRKFARKIVVIDDLANRKHDCDLLLDQNVIANYEHRYDELVPIHCKKLLGPKYLIMRDEFIKERAKQTIRTGEVNRLLVFMGGSDPTNETMKVLQALTETTTAFQHVDIVVGMSNVYRTEIEDLCRQHHYSYHCQINYMAKLMSSTDFSIGAGGSTTWERCYVGLPSASTIVAHNQLESTEMAEQLSAIINLGWHEQVTSQTYVKLLDSLPSQGERIRHISEQGLKITASQDQPNPWLQEMVESHYD